MKIHYLPIEPIPARYTEQMIRWVEAEMRREGLEYLTYLPTVDTATIEQGEFLDTTKSAVFKCRQLEMITHGISHGDVQDGDIILVGDVWYPGLEQVRMLLELQSLHNVTIAGWHYAGVYDPHDYYSKNLTAWSRSFETMIVRDVVDHVCCGSSFHADFVIRNTGARADRVHPLGLVWDPNEVKETHLPDPFAGKDPVVVFPHRMAPEKAPENFIHLASTLKNKMEVGRDYRFVFSMTRDCSKHYRQLNTDLGSPCEFVIHKGKGAKDSYYALLARAQFVYSAGYQETFGYSVHEAIALGCTVILPNRCSYPESVRGNREFLYDPHADPYGAELLGKHILACYNGRRVKTPFVYTESWGYGVGQFLRLVVEHGRRGAR